MNTTRHALAFEWTKFASLRSTWWILASALVVTLAGSWLFGMSAQASGANGLDSAMPAPAFVMQSMLVGELAFVVLGTFVITSEYSSGAIVSTLQSVPRRTRMLVSKAVLVFLVGFLGGAGLVLLGTPVAAVFAGDYGTFTAGELSRAMLGAGTGMGVLGVLSLGLGAALRSATLTLVVVLGLLQLVSNVLPLFGNEHVAELANYLPNIAISVLALEGPGPYGWPVALLVLAAWSAAGLVAGATILHRRDA